MQFWKFWQEFFFITILWQLNMGHLALLKLCLHWAVTPSFWTQYLLFYCVSWQFYSSWPLTTCPNNRAGTKCFRIFSSTSSLNCMRIECQKRTGFIASEFSKCSKGSDIIIERTKWINKLCLHHLESCNALYIWPSLRTLPYIHSFLPLLLMSDYGNLQSQTSISDSKPSDSCFSSLRSSNLESPDSFLDNKPPCLHGSMFCVTWNIYNFSSHLWEKYYKITNTKSSSKMNVYITKAMTLNYILTIW